MAIFNTIKEYNDFNNHDTLHPLVSVIDFSMAEVRTGQSMSFGLYCLVIKDVNCGDLKYGRHHYDYQEGTLVCISPGQVIDVTDKNTPYQPMGYGLVFHPDLLLGTPLGKNIRQYSFFGYQSHEALHLSKKEQTLLLNLMDKIKDEFNDRVDKFSKKLISTNIELFLDYCERFYDRQFVTRVDVNKGIMEKFEEILHHYFQDDLTSTKGLPSVSYCADQLHLSRNYLGDLVKKETGISAQEYIQNYVIELAKELVFDPSKSLSEIAYELGFKYPQHFSRLFKQKVGKSPQEFRNLN